MPELSVHEHYRQLFEICNEYRRISIRGSYEWGEFKHTGIERWCDEKSISYGFYGYSVYSRSILYTGNLTRLFRETEFRYIPMGDIVRSMGSIKINTMAVLGDMKTYFPYEALWKRGLRQYVYDRILRDGAGGLTRTGMYWEYKAEKPWLWFGISKEDFDQAVRLDAGDEEFRIIQRAHELNVRLTDEQAGWLHRYLGCHTVMEYFDIHTPHRIIRYLKEKAGVEECGKGKCENLLLWTDYLDTARQLGWDLRDRSVFFPQNIQHAHDEAVNVFMIKKHTEKAARLREQDEVMHRNAREIRKAFCYRDNKYMLVVPGNYLEFENEGHKQHNCVATYFENAVSRKCIILFIRKREEPDKPFCTVEIRNNNGRFLICQNRTAYNGDAPEDAKEFMKTAVKVAQRIAEETIKEECRRIQAAV